MGKFTKEQLDKMAKDAGKLKESLENCDMFSSAYYGQDCVLHIYALVSELWQHYNMAEGRSFCIQNPQSKPATTPVYLLSCPKCLKRFEFEGDLQNAPDRCPNCVSLAKDDEINRAKEALSIADEIQSLVDELPDAAEDFAQSIADKASDIAENIEKFNRVTDNQMHALENMLDGAKRWLND